ncbi:50S ribosomal protein L5 [candidate division WWE3 bacterium CG_4_9_14_3_um_filter_41_6]|uniref:Large ribosomal subunit protein uL5 n=1 Tax=candidate division WWE3 bacterium CG_4_10_14_0_2_um_filter_41_14 TaxID=1975072 RepID=A0A2M7TF46_UNCKA|nr:MAG: 50S ribosomal protein L5 [candidate division WWE3 bacterium CG_4_10_14_0_2_um_filter_41_14]PJA39247.1 MAG: 50S ribosomal protein L5 [candidate division WWE3 bacterium CG_4_9_14_3_um_filter_41_6]
MSTLYKETVAPGMLSSGMVKNIMAVPKIEKVIVNTGIGEIKENEEMIKHLFEQMTLITGQRPVIAKAKKSIAGFNVREGLPVGIRVTLRGERMYQFLDKVFNYVLPRTRDFQGLALSGFDGNGNYSFGLTEQLPFLEVDPNKVRRSFGLQVTIVTSTYDDTMARELLKGLGSPFEEENK